MRIHLASIVTEPEPSSRPALALIITFVAGAVLATAAAQLLATAF